MQQASSEQNPDGASIQPGMSMHRTYPEPVRHTQRREPHAQDPLNGYLSDMAQNAWDRLPTFQPNFDHLTSQRIVTHDLYNPLCSAFDMLRTRLLQRMRRRGWTTLAITSPTAGCGKSLTSVNLAFSVERHSRCLLLDLDLRRPRIGPTVGLRAGPIANLFEGQIHPEEALVRCGTNLAIAAGGRIVDRPAELLQSASAETAMRKLKDQFEPRVTICDLPPLLANDDALAFMPNADCVLLVLEAGLTRPEEALHCEQELMRVTNLVGVVLNKSRFTDETRHYY